jgi:hypothetical protein
MVTRNPRHLSNRPNDEAVRPLPSEEDTPPVKKMNLVPLPRWAPGLRYSPFRE